MSMIADGKKLLSLVNKVASRELYEKLVEYLDKVYELTRERGSLGEDLRSKKAEIAKLKEDLAWSKKLVQREEAMVIEGDSKSPVYCMICWHDQGKVIPLKGIVDGGECGVCKNTCTLSYFGDQCSGPGRVETEWDPLAEDR